MAPTPLNWTPLIGYETAFNQQQHVIFLGTDGIGVNVYELYYDGAWHLNNLTQLAGAPRQTGATALDAYATTFNNQQHINFSARVGNDVHVHELYYDGAWHWNDLTQLAGGPDIYGSGIDGYQTSFNNQQHVNFVGPDSHVHELFYDGSRWRHNDLTQLAGAPYAFASVVNGYETAFNQ